MEPCDVDNQMVAAPGVMEQYIPKSMIWRQIMAESVWWLYVGICQLHQKSVPKLWGMIICQCKCKGWMHHVNILLTKSNWWMINTLELVTPVTVMHNGHYYKRDETYNPNFSKCCHGSHRNSSQWAMQIKMYDDCHATSIHACYSNTLPSHMVPMVEISRLLMICHWNQVERAG